MAIDLGAIEAQLNESITGAVVERDGDWLVLDANQLTAVATHLRDEMGFDFLTHLSASDYADRLEVVYNLYSTRPELQGPCLPLKVRIPDRDNAHIPSLTSVWPSANYQEREVWDMFGIRFDGHPNMKRILLWEGFEGHPLRKDWYEPYYEADKKPFKSRWPNPETPKPRAAEERVRWRANLQYPEGFDPEDWEPVPEVDLEPGGTIDVGGIKTDSLLINIGPQHPSTHGVFRMVVGLQGETITSVYPVVGHLHRNHEKIGERNLWTGNMPYTERLDYISPMYNNFGYAVAVERMMDLEVAERAEYLRVIMGELTRTINHLLAVGFLFNELGAMMTPMIYGFTEREHVLDLFEEASGSRLMVNYFRFGGVARDVSDEWLARCRKVTSRLHRKIDEFETLLTDNEIFISRARGVSTMSWQELAAYGVTGPILRSAGLAYDIRKV